MPGLTDKIDAYYTEKLKEFGSTAKGVDWKDEASQHTRFTQLTAIITSQSFSLLDYGCGYGALLNFLNNEKSNVAYTGYDIAASMIAAAKARNQNLQNCFFTSNEVDLNKNDYVIASGIFNVRLDIADKEWENFIVETVKKMDTLSIKGFSFNMLPSYADEHLKKDYLYYAAPEWIQQICADITKADVEIVNNYGLFEFTVLIKK